MILLLKEFYFNIQLVKCGHYWSFSSVQRFIEGVVVDGRVAVVVVALVVDQSLAGVGVGMKSRRITEKLRGGRLYLGSGSHEISGPGCHPSLSVDFRRPD